MAKIAEYNGKCDCGCGNPVFLGATAVVEIENIGWVRVDCATQIAPADNICPNCHEQRAANGACSCD